MKKKNLLRKNRTTEAGLEYGGKVAADVAENNAKLSQESCTRQYALPIKRDFHLTAHEELASIVHCIVSPRWLYGSERTTSCENQSFLPSFALIASSSFLIAGQKIINATSLVTLKVPTTQERQRHERASFLRLGYSALRHHHFAIINKYCSMPNTSEQLSLT